MFNKFNYKKNEYCLNGKFAKRGYDWWWHSFTAINKKTGQERPFYIEFFIINPKLSPDKVVLGQDPENKKNGKKPSYMMVNCGSWTTGAKQLHRFFATGDVKINTRPIIIQADDCYLDEHRTYGHVFVDSEHANEATMSDAGEIKWDLKIEKKISFDVGYGTCGLFKYLKAFQMYWHAQGMKTQYSGTVTFDGEEYVVTPETCYGYADKNWGSDFTTPWLWLSSNNITRKTTGEKLNNTVFDIGGGKPRAFGIDIPKKLLGAYFIEGKQYEYNFSKLWHPSKTSFSFREGDDGNVYWHVEQSDRKSKIVTDIACKAQDMIFINYEAPLGLKRHTKLFNGGNGWGELKIYHKEKGEYRLIDELICKNVGCEYGEFDKDMNEKY